MSPRTMSASHPTTIARAETSRSNSAALSRDRWINVANWASEADFRAAHSTDEFRRVVTQSGWEEFPSLPVLYEVATAVG
jgi:hypothetical protein